MTKIIALGLLAAALLITPGAFAGDKADAACCAHKTASGEQTKACADLEAMNLTAEQKTKVQAWSAECMKGGCTKESRRAFFQQAKAILSAEQFAQLKAECKKGLPKQEKTQS